MIWYVARNGERLGPLDEADVRARAARGEIADDDLVWHSGAADWRAARDVPGLLPPVAIEPSGPQGSYFVRHWRGELSLPVSYWLNGFACSALIVVLFLLVDRIDWTEHWRVAATASVVLLLLALVMTAWQSVGVWRSADRHPARGGRPGWAAAAKVMVVLGAMQTGAQTVFSTGPMIGELGLNAAGDPEMAGTTLELHGDDELSIAGPIAFGLTQDVQRALDANPGVTIVSLDSIGGRIEEALKLSRLIEQRGLDTYVGAHCASACTLVFVAGDERIVHEDAQLGFHGLSMPGLNPIELGRSTRDVVEFLVKRGVTRDFAERAFDRGTVELWYPSIAELEAAGVATTVAVRTDVVEPDAAAQ